jgi:hypothetical protein
MAINGADAAPIWELKLRRLDRSQQPFTRLLLVFRPLWRRPLANRKIRLTVTLRSWRSAKQLGDPQGVLRI